VAVLLHAYFYFLENAVFQEAAIFQKKTAFSETG
jgi:hypothetical protein